MENFKGKLEAIETEIESKKIQKAKLEQKKEQLEKDKNEIIAELAGENLTPEKLAEEINKLELEIKSGIDKCNSILEVEEDD